MIKTLLFFLIITACNGIVDTPTKEIDTPPMENEDSLKLNYLALGDSYTIGEGVLGEESFPYQLINADLKVPHAVGQFKIIARTGWTTRDLLDAMEEENIAEIQWDFITLLIGVNNQYQRKPFSQYETEFNELMDRALQLADNDPKKIIVVSIPDYSVTPFAAGKDPETIAKELKEYNDYNKKISEQRGTRYVYITDLTQEAANDLSLLADDKLHPSGKSYGQWVKRMIPEVNDIVDSL